MNAVKVLISSTENLTPKDKEIAHFATRFGVVFVAILLIELLKLNFIALCLSIAGHGYLLYFCYKLFGEYKSDLPKYVMLAVLLGSFGEIAIFFNPSYAMDNIAFWVFIACHFVRNLVLSGKLFMDIYKSDIYNYFWVKALPYPCVALLFILLEIFVFGKDSENFLVFLIYNAVNCLPVLFAALRHHHTSYRGFYLMILGTLALVISEIFYFLKIMETSTESMIVFRATFLLLGNAIVLVASYDHVTEFDKSSQKRIYFGANDDIFSKPRAKAIMTSMKPMQEPLI